MTGHDRRRQEKYGQILESALKLFSESGIRKVTVTDIAESAGASRVTVFKYFENKDELVRQCIRRYFLDLSRKIASLLDTQQSYRQRLRALMTAKIESFHAFQDELFPWLKKQDRSFVDEIMELRHRSIKDSVMPFIEQGREEGWVYPDLRDEAIFLYLEILGLGLMSGSHVMEQGQDDPAIQENVLNLASRALLRGIDGRNP